MSWLCQFEETFDLVVLVAAVENQFLDKTTYAKIDVTVTTQKSNSKRITSFDIMTMGAKE